MRANTWKAIDDMRGVKQKREQWRVKGLQLLSEAFREKSRNDVDGKRTTIHTSQYTCFKKQLRPRGREGDVTPEH